MSGFLVFDTETTGVDVFEDRVVQCYIGRFDSAGNLTERWEWLIDPGIDVPEEASNVHGFTTEHLREHGLAADHALREIIGVFSRHMDIPWVAYNLNFDLSILDAEFKRHGFDDLWGEMVAQNVRLFDPLVIDRAQDKYRKGKRTLEAVAGHYGVPFDPELAHEAGYDVAVTAQVLLKVTGKYGYPTNAIQAEAYREWAEHLEEYLRGANKDDTIKVDADWPLRQKEETNA